MDGTIGAGAGAQLEAVGLVSLGWWDNGIRHITNSKRPINRPEDLHGLKIRTPADPATIDTFQALGAATQQINFSELYVALQQGVVDGQENPLANIHSGKLHEVNRFISLTGHKWECYPGLRLAHRLGPAEPGGPAPRSGGGERGRSLPAHPGARGRHAAVGRVPRQCGRRGERGGPGAVPRRDELSRG